MPQARGESCLAAKPLDGARLAQMMIVQRLERDDAVRIEVLGAIDRAHRTSADHDLDEVRPDDAPDEIDFLLVGRVGRTDAQLRPLAVGERVAVFIGRTPRHDPMVAPVRYVPLPSQFAI